MTPPVLPYELAVVHESSSASSLLTCSETIPERRKKAGCQTGEALPVEDPDTWLYRDRTIAMLRRYLRISIEVGRLPSLLGREFFRTRVTSYSVTTFEDAVIFVHDVEKTLEKLDEIQKNVIARIVFQENSQEETARLLNCARRTVVRLFPEAIDRLSELFLEGGLLTRLVKAPPAPESCQGGKKSEIPVSECNRRQIKIWETWRNYPHQLWYSGFVSQKSRNYQDASNASFCFFCKLT